jgi:dipeptidyl-peptidase-4
MNVKYLLAFSGILFISFVSAQQKNITLQDIWGGTFRTERMQSLHSMNNGQQYSVLNFDRSAASSSIDLYDYETLEKIKTSCLLKTLLPFLIL